MVIATLQARCPVSAEAISAGLQSVELSGRCQVVPGPVQQVLDVAHNLESARQLAGSCKIIRSAVKPGWCWVCLMTRM